MTKKDKDVTTELSPETGLYLALAQFQSEMDFVKKGTSGYNYKYSDYPSLVEVIREGFKGKNLCFTHILSNNDKGNLVLTTKVIYACPNGNGIASIESTLPVVSIPVIGKDGRSKTNALQSQGSGITYLKRYTLQALVGLPSEDDDGASSNVQAGNYKKADTPPKNINRLSLKPFNEKTLEGAKQTILDKIKENKDATTILSELMEMSKNTYSFDENMQKIVHDYIQNLIPPI